LRAKCPLQGETDEGAKRPDTNQNANEQRRNYHVTEAAADGDDDGVCDMCSLTESSAHVCCGSTGSIPV